MSQENVEIIHRVYEVEDIDALALEAMHPEVELLGAIGGIEEGTTTVGREAVMQAVAIESDIWAERRLELREAIDAGDRWSPWCMNTAGEKPAAWSLKRTSPWFMDSRRARSFGSCRT